MLKYLMLANLASRNLVSRAMRSGLFLYTDDRDLIYLSSEKLFSPVFTIPVSVHVT